MEQINGDREMFKFILPINLNHYSNIPYFAKVYAETKDDMDLFLKQHNLMCMRECVTPISCYEFYEKRDVSQLLHNYKFKSNNSDEVFNIMTTKSIIESCITSVCEMINQYTLFGEAIMRRDIPIIVLISSLLENHMKYITIQDYELADGCLYDTYEEGEEGEYLTMIRDQSINCMDILNKKDIIDKMFNTEYYSEHTMDLESCFYEEIVEDIMPVTVEHYVSIFIALLTDEY